MMTYLVSSVIILQNRCIVNVLLRIEHRHLWENSTFVVAPCNIIDLN